MPGNLSIHYSHFHMAVLKIVFGNFSGRVNFIDHEYAMYNYEHYEIGNHFCEYAGNFTDSYSYTYNSAMFKVSCCYYNLRLQLNNVISRPRISIKSCFLKTKGPEDLLEILVI